MIPSTGNFCRLRHQQFRRLQTLQFNARIHGDLTVKSRKLYHSNVIFADVQLTRAQITNAATPLPETVCEKPFIHISELAHQLRKNVSERFTNHVQSMEKETTIMLANLNSRVIRLLVSAEGYMELGMPKQALEELHSIDDAGVLEPPRQYLVGRALAAQGLFEDAVSHLEFAARQMPSPVKRIAWRALSECYRECGSNQLAEVAADIAGPEPVEDVSIQFPGMEVSVSLGQLVR